ncbi:acyltransferase family protein [Thermomonospora cellulosilytica]|uniref:Fucose 4-O-acetylase-like acetyltransferase n=1 Tax=Thermomonospora cellulosilytica TaxID=1411118 RepID=A0A7W3N301_9ACTN|nr:acyltransferase [Thermomonospora cellulosilytica]MBA9006621.1 fucose 4-O-acetylase-like acetyltransferase [Thermomonospora cellulosilytica]
MRVKSEQSATFGGNRFTARAAELAARTPADRDRHVDFLRVGSLAVVVLGHWLMAVPLTGPDGSVRAGNALAVMPSLQPLTWLLQVMPVFFFVGGFSHAKALRRGPRYGEFVRARAARLLVPTAVFAAVWLAAALLVELAGRDEGVLRLATRVVAQPLWFVGVYLAMVAFAPPMWRLHRSYGAAVPVALGVGVVAVDLLRFGYGVTAVAPLNLLLVWLAVHQLGFCHADGRLGRRVSAALAGCGLTAMLALIAWGPYPLSMVGMPGAPVSNMSPPTLALFTHALWLIGLTMLLHGPAARMLARPRVWIGVIAANGLAMTAFLWHLTALFLLCAVQFGLGLPRPAVGEPAWWLSRPLWLALLAAATAGLVALFRRADRPRRPAPRSHGPLRDVAGITLCVLGVLGFSAVGFGGTLAGRTATLVVLPVSPALCLGLLAAGAALLGLFGGPSAGAFGRDRRDATH